jgi:hypothetical protein
LHGNVVRGVTREVEFQDTSEQGVAGSSMDMVNELELMAVPSTYSLLGAFSTKSHFAPFIDLISQGIHRPFHGSS